MTPKTRKRLDLLTLKELEILATTQEAPEPEGYSELDLGIAWELYDRLYDGRLT